MNDPLDVLNGDGAGDGAGVPEPPAPPVETPANGEQQTAEEKQDAEEWGDAIENVFPDLEKPTGKDNNEPAKSEKTEEAAGEGKETATPKKPDEAAGSGKDRTPESGQDKGDGNKPADDDGGAGNGEEEDSEQVEQVDPAEAISSRSAREERQLLADMGSSVREKMFKDAVTELKDADGDPIKTIEDVMAHVNPKTGERYTEEEAGMWLLQANQQMRDNNAAMEKQIADISETQLGLKDDADIINFQYGELLKAMPDVRKQLSEAYGRTVIRDPKSGLITRAPVSLKQFYETALEPYAEMGRRLEAQEAAKQTQTPAANNGNGNQPEAPTKSPSEAQRLKEQRRQDRSDIYGNGKRDLRDDDTKEWDDAALNVFGEDQLRAAGLMK